MRHLVAAACCALAMLLAGHCKQLKTRGVDTLVLYVFRYTDAQSTANLEFFFNHGLKEHDGAHYYILIQESDRVVVKEVRFTVEKLRIEGAAI